MCPLCMTNAALVVAGAASGAGVVGFVAVKVRVLQRIRRDRQRRTEQQKTRRETCQSMS